MSSSIWNEVLAKKSNEHKDRSIRERTLTDATCVGTEELISRKGYHITIAQRTHWPENSPGNPKARDEGEVRKVFHNESRIIYVIMTNLYDVWNEQTGARGMLKMFMCKDPLKQRMPIISLVEPYRAKLKLTED